MDGTLQRVPGRLVMLGFGSVGRAVLPLLRRHLGLPADRLVVLAPPPSCDAARRALASAQATGVRFEPARLGPDDYRSRLAPLLGPGDFLLNLAVNVDSLALIALCRARGALYLDTCVEPWTDGFSDPRLPPEARSNNAQREAALALRTPGRDAPTALVAHGANPGVASHLVKQALLDVARASGLDPGRPQAREDWARLAQRAGVKAIHVAERDSQAASRRRAPGEFVNTWSVEGFIDEACCQPAELGWGTHERHFPADGHRHAAGRRCAIWLSRPGCETRVRSWAPGAGAYRGLLVTHAESISIADLLTLGPPEAPAYRPTVLYAYRPCDDAMLSLDELAGGERQRHPTRRVACDELVEGLDELGVLLMGPARGAYWFGSRLSLARAREMAPDNSATSLQVAAGVLSGVVWTLRNPMRDVVEADDLPHDELLSLCWPYLGELEGHWTDWTPLQGRGWLFEETLDTSDPWQFLNVRVA